MPKTLIDVSHDVVAATTPEAAFDLVADVTRGPLLFASHLHAEVVERGAEQDLIARWVIRNGLVHGWRFWRSQRLNEQIVFVHDRPEPPMTGARGEWTFVRLGDMSTQVAVRHTCELDDDSQSVADDLRNGLDKQVMSQLLEVKTLAEQHRALRSLVVEFSRSVRVPISSGEASGRLMGGETADETAWARVCRPGVIAYKRVGPLSPLVNLSSGRFLIEAAGDTTEVTVVHTATLLARRYGRVKSADGRVRLIEAVRNCLEEEAGNLLLPVIR